MSLNASFFPNVTFFKGLKFNFIGKTSILLFCVISMKIKMKVKWGSSDKLFVNILNFQIQYGGHYKKINFLLCIRILLLFMKYTLHINKIANYFSPIDVNLKNINNVRNVFEKYVCFIFIIIIEKLIENIEC